MCAEQLITSKPFDFEKIIAGLQAERDIILDECEMPFLIVEGKLKRILKANMAAARLFRRPADELIGKPVTTLITQLSGASSSKDDGEPVLITGNASKPSFRARMLRRILPGRERQGRELISLSSTVAVEPSNAMSEQRFAAVSAAASSGIASVVGSSDAIRRVCRLIGKVARTGSTVLIQGESGTGKEVCAKAIHLASQRADRSFVGVNCSALSESLLESELFGHVKGAFTGAIRDRHGRFRQAHRGTLLLDEIGSMAIASQSRLLRVLQERCYEPLGSSKSVDVDVRVVATTNVDLELAVNEKTFREDLFYRLNVISIEMPPLRERREDIPLLASEFLGRNNQKLGKRLRGISPESLELLLNQAWPGNVRQLENTLERAAVLEESDVIQPDSLGLDDSSQACRESPTDGMGLRRQLEIIERHIVLDTLRRSDWVCKCAAARLGIDPRNFNYFLKKHNISAGQRQQTSEYSISGG